MKLKKQEFDAVTSTIYSEIKRDYDQRMSQFLNSTEMQRHKKSVEKDIEKAQKLLPKGFYAVLEGYGSGHDYVSVYMNRLWKEKKIKTYTSDEIRRWVTMNASEYKTLQEIRKAALAHFTS
jgi:predicted KAP-like P-loop ATPase